MKPDEATIEACRVTEFWPPADDAQEWDSRPAINESDCVEGKRRTKGQGPPIWTFELTELAQPWGEDPFDNQGVLFRGALPEDADPRENWHVNLKAPARDKGDTEQDEYPQTRGRVVVQLAFVPGEPEVPVVPPPSTPTVPTGSSFGRTGNFFTPATDFGSTDVGTFGDPISDTGPPPA